MKQIKRIIVSGFLFALLFLTGCGIEVSTDMTINQAFEGTRTISCFVSNQDMKLHFNGDSEKIDTMIENHCPGCFETSKQIREDGIEYLFVLRFSSLDDYKTQLNSILNFTPEINYTGIHSIFSKTFTLSENFTTLDLLRWFEILLSEEYSIEESSLTSMWSIKNTNVKWQDQNFTLKSDKINISEHVSSPFDGISIFTEEHDNRSFTRKIQFSIPKETLDKRLHELEAYFESLKPEGTTGIWTTTTTGKIYEMTYQADTFELLSIKTALILKKNSEVPAASTISLLPNIYSQLVLEYSEHLDFSNFLSTEQGEVPVSYYFKPNSMMELNSERLQREINNAFIPKEYEDGYYRIFEGNCSTLKITTIGTLILPIHSYDMTTTIKKEDLISREFIFSFPDILTEKEKELYSSALSNNSDQILSLSLKEDNGDLKFVLKQTGGIKALNESSSLLFGMETPSITIEHEGFLFSLIGKKVFTITEQVDLTKILGANEKAVSGTYELRDHYFKNIQSFQLDSEETELAYQDNSSSSSKSAPVTGNVFKIQYTCAHFSPYRILLLILLGTLTGAGFFYYKKKFYKRTTEDIS